MRPGELAILFVSGAMLVAAGLFPHLLQSLADGIRNFSASISYSVQGIQPHLRAVNNSSRVWLVAIGLALIVASCVLAISA